MPDNDRKLIPLEIPLNGKLMTAEDPVIIGTNFRSLKNMRYTNSGIRGIAGMTKINTTALTTYLKPRSIFHFTKDPLNSPTVLESHVMVQAWNSGDTASVVYENNTTIPNQGNFVATALWTDSTDADIGKFSNAPDESVAYCNGRESLIWSGDEYRCAAFYNFNPDNSFVYNYSEAISNVLQTTGNTAILKKTTAASDANELLLLHLNTDFTDSSPTTPHTVTANGGAAINTSTKKFGAGSCYFDGTGDYLTIPDNADFDFSDGTWTIDFWVNIVANAATNVIYDHRTDASNYFTIYFDYSPFTGLSKITLSIYSAGVEVVFVQTGQVINHSTWNHIEIAENGNDYYIFINGSLQAYSSDANRPANYTGSVYIGDSTAGSLEYKGYLDEFRISNICRHTANFTPSTGEHGSSSVTYAYIGSTRPLQGFKFYIKTANATAATMGVSYWNGSAWTSVSSLVDGTLVSGKTLAQTGEVTFTSTVSTAKPKVLYDIFIYWYLISWTGIDENTDVYYITVDAPMQPILDIWDGTPRQVFAYYKLVGSTYTDHTFEVNNDVFLAGDVTTYVELDSLAATSYQIVGFPEPVTGLMLHFIGGHINTTVNTIITIEYWNGSAWTTVGAVDDGTKGTTQSYNKSGIISWNAPVFGSEQKWYNLSRGPQVTTSTINQVISLYYYRINFSQALSGDVQLYYIGGIPAQIPIGGYAFPVYANNRLFLCNNKDTAKNSVLVSARDSNCVFNGYGSTELLIGGNKELICGAMMFVQFGSSLYNMILFYKRSEFWAMIGNGPEDWILYQVHKTIGCIAPATLKIIDVIADNFIGKIAIWQGASGIHVFDGKTTSSIHEGIKNFFDRQASDKINFSYSHISTAEYDEFESEYHWFFASGSSTTCNREFVYNFKRQAWYEIDRGTGKYIQVATIVNDLIGNAYMYGGIDTGYLERLENGTDFDGTAITHEFWLGDMAFTGSNYESEIRRIKLTGIAKTVTTNEITVTRYGNGITTAVTLDQITISPVKTGSRIYLNNQGFRGPYNYHSLRFQMTTSDETIGFEPLKIDLFLHHIREDY